MGPENKPVVTASALPLANTRAAELKVVDASAAVDAPVKAAAAAKANEGTLPGATEVAAHQEKPEPKAAALEDDHFSQPLGLHDESLADAYEKLGEPIGEGTYGTVWRARCRRTGNTVAMKRVDLRNAREGFPVTAIREIRALHRLCRHANIVNLVDVCTAPPATDSGAPGDAYLIFEYAPSDLTGLLAYRKNKLKLPEIKCLMKQMLDALDYCHMNHMMHRDMKPSNVLITGKGELKLCDFGLSREFHGAGNYSTRVITLWYRPPELLLGARRYDESIDVWSAGCIFGELLAGAPLFPESSEIKVFQKICERCGALQPDAWPDELRRLPQWEKFAPKGEKGSGSDIFADLQQKYGSPAVELLAMTLRLDPSQRINAAKFGNHCFFNMEPHSCQPSEIKINQHLSCHELDVKRHREKVREEREAQRVQAANKRPGAPAVAGAPGGAVKDERIAAKEDIRCEEHRIQVRDRAAVFAYKPPAGNAGPTRTEATQPKEELQGSSPKRARNQPL